MVSTIDDTDVNPGDGVCLAQERCTLRAAIQEANDFPGADTIVLQVSGPYLLTLQEASAGAADEELAATGDLDVTGPLTIESPGGAAPRQIEVAFGSRSPEDRIFHVHLGGDLTLRDVILADGVATSASTSTGGAIR
ncbi:MAG: CSLREA domain-containing protein, partial [Myxococcota bacterium]